MQLAALRGQVSPPAFTVSCTSPKDNNDYMTLNDTKRHYVSYTKQDTKGGSMTLKDTK